jgi:hypothetical protein
VHTNPILICFCSILYYRELAEQIRRYRIEKEIVKRMDSTSSDGEIYFSLKEFTGKLRNEPLKGRSSTNDQLKIKVYKKHILNRWHLFVRLTLNKELIAYRGHNLKKIEIIEHESSMLKKMMLLCKKKE